VRRFGLAALPAALLIYGCAGDGPPLSTATSAYDVIQQQIFNQHCLSAGCHNATAQAGNLNLTAGVSYGDLVNVTPDNAVAAANGLLRVEPFNPDNSFIIVKLTGPPPGEGARMPQGMAPLSPSDIAMIRDWIADGAPPPEGTAVATATPSASPTETLTPTVADTPTITPTPVDTDTPTPTVTGTPPPTATASQTPTASPTLTPLPWLPRIQETIFNPSCAIMFCHDKATASGNLVLTADESYANLVNVTPDNAVARNRGLLRVVPDDPAQSFLIVKVTQPPLGEGSKMPLTGTPLTAEQIALLTGWIEAGAPQD
jgi:mono/diheme cytochrome c family protein